MFNYINKICPELLKVTTLSNKEIKSDCFLYSSNYNFLKQQLDNENIKYFEYPFIKAFGVKLNIEQILKYAAKSMVSFISQQTKVYTQIEISKRIMAIDKFYENNIYGNNITIAIIDTGIKPHLDFVMPRNRIIKFVDLINNKQKPYDDNGHGTFVAGVACGNGLISGRRFCSIAPQANIISIKALEKNGEAGAFKILEAMQWIFNNKEKYNIKVVCMSFGSVPLEKNDPLISGAEALWNVGITVVAAAGNSGPESNTIKSPGFSSKIITVGGLDDNRITNLGLDKNLFEVASFSSRGPAGFYYKPDLIAPAVNIKSASIEECFYSVMSGTSVAAPMVAGVCCLILSKYPSFTPEEVKIKLLQYCKKLSKNKNEEGFGYLNFDKFFE